MKQVLRIFIWLIIFGNLITDNIYAQSISTSIPNNVEPKEIFLFYLHGGVVQEQGPNAVSLYYGKYEYYAILDSLSNKGLNIISEVRPKGTTEIEYAIKINHQIDTLVSLGVPLKNIIIAGASLGGYIALEVAQLAKKPGLNFVLIGLCSDYVVDYYSNISPSFYGNFLSIFEKSDKKGSCKKIFANKKDVVFKEVELNMGIDHAFLFKPFQEWIDPLIEWVKKPCFRKQQ